MDKLPLNALRAFAAVRARGGLRAAARALGITHSSVSRHVAELERSVGVALVHRTRGRGPLRLTPQGEMLARAAESGLREIASAVQSLQEARSPGSVNIGVRPSLAVRWLLPRLPAFEEQHPEIEVSVSVDARPEAPDVQGLDVGIRMAPGPWPGLRWEPFMDDALYPVMSPALWEEHGRPRTPAQLVGLRLLHDRDPHAAWEAWRLRFGPESLDVRSGPRLTSSDLVLRAAGQGQGVALARHRLATDDLESGLLCRPIPDLAVDLPEAYSLVHPKYATPRNAVTTVVEWLKHEAAQQVRAGAVGSGIGGRGAAGRTST